MKESNHDMFFGSWYNLQDGSGIYAIVNSLGYIWKLKIQEND